MAYSSTLSTKMWNCSAVSCSAPLVDQFLGIGCGDNFRIRFGAKRLLGSLAKRFLHEIFRTLERHFRAPVSAKSFGDGKACCKIVQSKGGLQRDSQTTKVNRKLRRNQSEVRNNKKDIMETE